jgi:hypothetical protein
VRKEFSLGRSEFDLSLDEFVGGLLDSALAAGSRYKSIHVVTRTRKYAANICRDSGTKVRDTM